MENSGFLVGRAVSVGIGQVPVHRILCPNAGVMTGPGTNTYLVGQERLALIDPGPALEAHVDSILQIIGDRTLEWILVTHTHHDHSPSAALLRSVTGARVVGLPPAPDRSEEHTSELQSRPHLVCRLLLEKK